MTATAPPVNAAAANAVSSGTIQHVTFTQLHANYIRIGGNNTLNGGPLTASLFKMTPGGARLEGQTFVDFVTGTPGPWYDVPDPFTGSGVSASDDSPGVSIPRSALQGGALYTLSSVSIDWNFHIDVASTVDNASFWSEAGASWEWNASGTYNTGTFSDSFTWSANAGVTSQGNWTMTTAPTLVSGAPPQANSQFGPWAWG